jgi:hypothetical protein
MGWGGGEGAGWGWWWWWGGDCVRPCGQAVNACAAPADVTRRATKRYLRKDADALERMHGAAQDLLPCQATPTHAAAVTAVSGIAAADLKRHN